MKRIKHNIDNVGGLISLYIIPPSSFLRLRKDYTDNTSYLELQNKDDIIEIPVLFDSSYSFTEVHSSGNHGDSWEITVQGVIPAVGNGSFGIISELQRGYWYVVCIDGNGCSRLCGTEDVPMKFLTNTTTGSKASDLNGINFELHNIQAEPAVIISNDSIE